MKSLKLIGILFLACFVTFNTMAQDDRGKSIVKKWKMIKTEDNGTEVDPEHDRLVLQIEKDKSFTITAVLEETHNGTWKIENDNLVLTDTETGDVKTLGIKDLDNGHLALSGYDKPTATLYFVPVTGKKQVSLNHKEFLVAKKWTVFQSDKQENVGMRLEFKADKSFIMIPFGYKVPVASGTWSFKEGSDHKVLLIEQKDNEKPLELDVIELHRHELVLKFHESGISNHLHDPKLAKNDKKLIAEAHKNDK